MPYEALLYDVADGVATITINRPERRNALSWTVMSELRALTRSGPSYRYLTGEIAMASKRESTQPQGRLIEPKRGDFGHYCP